MVVIVPVRVTGVGSTVSGVTVRMTVVAKLVTGWIVAKRAESSPRGRWRAGSLLAARGEFSVLIAGIVATSPFAPDKLVPLATTYVLITAIAGPILAKVAEPWSNFLERRRSPGLAAASD